MGKPQIPFAFDEQNNIVEPGNITEGYSYFCPNCNEKLQIRTSFANTKFFTHNKNKNCNFETISLKIAKHLIQKSIFDWKNNNALSPIIIRRCKICNSVKEQKIPEKVGTTILDYKLSSNEILDVALLSNEKPIAAIELTLNEDQYDPKPRYNYSIPFIQLLAYDIINNPDNWEPIIDRFKQFSCSKCDENLKIFNETVLKVSRKINIKIPVSYYRYSYCYCWKCNNEILVFTWPGKNIFPEHKPLKQPIPKTIQFRYSKTAGSKYWVNTCPYCNSIQGDFYLYGEPDGPFFGFECSEDNPVNFKNDLKSLASYAAYMASVE